MEFNLFRWSHNLSNFVNFHILIINSLHTIEDAWFLKTKMLAMEGEDSIKSLLRNVSKIFFIRVSRVITPPPSLYSVCISTEVHIRETSDCVMSVILL